MHLKNFSLISRDNKIYLSPVYDLLNSTIVQKKALEEIALPIRGRKNNLSSHDFIDYFAKTRMKLNEKIISEVITQFQSAIPQWFQLLQRSFLSQNMQEKYAELITTRQKRLGI